MSVHGIFSTDSSTAKVLATESNTFKRCVREAFEIGLRKPSLDRDKRKFPLFYVFFLLLLQLRYKHRKLFYISIMIMILEQGDKIFD